MDNNNEEIRIFPTPSLYALWAISNHSKFNKPTIDITDMQTEDAEKAVMALINNQQQLDAEIQEMVSNNFGDLINE